MNTHSKDLPALFEQLGLDSDQVSIDRFIKQHSPLAGNVHVADAPFWQQNQAHFLRDKLLQDAEWSDAVDQLNLALRN